MSLSHPSNNRFEDLPLAIAMLVMSMGKPGQRVGCVIVDGNLFSIGEGDFAEFDAVAGFGTALGSATLYVTRPPCEMAIKFLEKCGLRQLVVLQDPPDDHGPVARGILCVDYCGPCVYRLRDMVKSLETGLAI